MPYSGTNLVNQERLWADLMELGEITEPDNPYTRRAFTPEFAAGREWLERKFMDSGLDTRIDSVGNLYGRLEGSGSSGRHIVSGSHSDTVRSGGRFDGIAGVIVALEVARCLQEQSISLNRAFEVVDFLAEEPGDFGLSCIGSRGIAGQLEEEMLNRTDGTGESLSDAINRVGGNVDDLDGARRNDIDCFLELHIEQGLQLERNETDVGIVTAIAGISRVGIVFKGQAAHAGTIPLEWRHDAAVAGAEMISFVRQKATDIASASAGHFVATVGRVEISPNAANVVPRTFDMIVDARAEFRPDMNKFLADVQNQAKSISANTATELKALNILSDTMPVACSPELRDYLSTSAEKLGFSQMAFASGAGHDTAFMAQLVPAAMIFVPCKQGRSHTPHEWSNSGQLAAGASVLLDAIRRIDKGLKSK